MNLTEKQALAYLLLTENKRYTEIGYGGAAGGGKSFLGCLWILRQALKYPKTAWLIGRKELTNLKKTTLLSLFKVIDVLGLHSKDILEMNSQTNIIVFKNESRIFLMDTAFNPSDPLYTRFGGLELTGAFIDESNETEKEAIEIIKSRLGRCLNEQYGIRPKLLETFNPSKNHIYFRYYKPFKNKTLPDYRIFIQALATDNYYLDNNYIEQLKKSDKITKERLLYGNFEYEDDSSKLFEYDKIIDIFTNKPKHVVNEQYYISMDVARYGDDKTIIMVWYGFEIVKIYKKEKAGLDESQKLLEEIMNKYSIPRSNVIVDEDGLGGGIIDHLRGVKGFINNSRPLEKKEIQTAYTNIPRHNFANLKSQCYFKLADYVNQGKIGCSYIDDNIKGLIIEDLEQIKRKDPDKDGKLAVIPKEDIKEHLQRSPDFGDAMMMRMIFELKEEYVPYLAGGGVWSR